MNPNVFDICKSFFSKSKIDDLTEYNEFVINRILSSSLDLAFIVNELNCRRNIPKHIQYLFYYTVIKKGKYYTQWYNKTKLENIEKLKLVYGYNEEKAKSIYNLITEDGWKKINNSLETGGKK